MPFNLVSYLVTFELSIRKLDLEFTLLCIRDRIVWNVVDLSLDFAHSLNNASIWLHHIAERLSSPNLERHVLGRRRILDVQMAHIVAMHERNDLLGVERHKLANVSSCDGRSRAAFNRCFSHFQFCLTAPEVNRYAD